MGFDLDYVLTECAIRQLQGRYADAVWRLDYDAFGDCFTENCEWRIDGVVLRGRTEIVAQNRTVFSQNFERLFITLRTPILEVGTGADLGSAWGRTYFSAQNRMRDGTGFAPIGLYFERFVAEEGRWRISWRHFQTLYSGPADLTGTLHDQPDYGAPPAMPPLDAMSREVTGLNRPIR